MLIAMKKYAKIYKKHQDFYENQNPSKQPKNKGLAKYGCYNRNQHIFLTNLNQFSSQKLHGTPHSCKIRHFLRVFAYFRPRFRAIFSPVWPFPIQNPYSGPPGIILPYRNITHDPPGTSLDPPNPRLSPLHLWQTNSKFALWSETTRIRWG